MNEVTLGERLQKGRKELNMTQQQLADECGLSVDTIKSYECGRRNPRKDYLQDIADVLEMDFNYLSKGYTTFRGQ